MKKFMVEVVIERSESINVEVEAENEGAARELAIDAALAGEGTSIDIQTMDTSTAEVHEV